MSIITLGAVDVRIGAGQDISFKIIITLICNFIIALIGKVSRTWGLHDEKQDHRACQPKTSHCHLQTARGATEVCKSRHSYILRPCSSHMTILTRHWNHYTLCSSSYPYFYNDSPFKLNFIIIFCMISDVWFVGLDPLPPPALNL